MQHHVMRTQRGAQPGGELCALGPWDTRVDRSPVYGRINFPTKPTRDFYTFNNCGLRRDLDTVCVCVRVFMFCAVPLW